MRGTSTGAVATAVVIDSNQHWQDASASLLAHLNVEVVATSSELRCAPALVEAHRCDVLLVGVENEADSRMMYWCLRRAHRLHPEAATIVLVRGDDTALVDAALAAGAYMAIDRNAAPAVLSGAVNEVLAGNAIAGSRAVTNGGGTATRPRLTRRELEILRLVADGRSNREVAKLLWVTDQTVKFHLANTYRKLGVRNRIEAGLWAAEHGLVHAAADRAELRIGSAVAVATQ